MFDISSISLADTFVLQLKHPVTQAPLGEGDEAVTITLYGSASKQYRNHIAGMQDRTLKRQAKKEQPTTAVLRQESVNLLVACSASSTNLAHNGKPVETEQDFRDLYSDTKVSWIQDQVNEALGDIGNFLSQ